MKRYSDQTKNKIDASEVWRPVHGWPYLVSNHGRLARSDTKQLKSLGSQKYMDSGPRLRFVILKNNGRRHRVMIGTLVAEAFIGPRPEGFVVLYKDRNYNNNHVDNLRYAPRAEAVAHHRGDIHE